jgi:hypothetical protein
MANVYWQRTRQHASSSQLGGGGDSLASAWHQQWQHNQQSTKSVGGYGDGSGDDDSDDDDDKNEGDRDGGGSLATARWAAWWDHGCGGTFTSVQWWRRSGAAAVARGCGWLTSRK